MVRISLHSIRQIIVLGAFTANLHAAVANSGSNSAPTSSRAGVSDPGAVRAMNMLLVRSGGASAWRDIRSVKERFTVSTEGDSPSSIHVLLDDWSLESTRYRRRVLGETNAPPDHNGTPTQSIKLAGVQHEFQEFDQARVLATRLPAAAAEVMLRKSEYVLKLSTVRKCSSDYVCIDVFRSSGNQPLIPEQQWVIAVKTGLPEVIRIEEPNVIPGARSFWKDVHFLQYAAEEGVIVPTSMDFVNFHGSKTSWKLTSFKTNCGFDTTKFDQEAGE